MAIGDVHAVKADRCRAYRYVDVGSYDVEAYGAVYVIDAERPAVIDTGLGTNVDLVFAALDELGIERASLSTVAVTHVHLDHAGGAGHLLEACPNATLYVHERGARHLIDPSRLVEGTKRAVRDQWRYYREPRPVSPDRVVELSDGDVIDLGNRALEVHHAPGHAPHQVVFHDPDARAVATADAAGIWVPSLERIVPTTPPPDFDLERALEDVELLRALEPETLLFGHFGDAGRADERLEAYERVLTSWVETVAELRSRLGDDDAVIDRLQGGDPALERAWGSRKAEAEVSLNVRGVLTYLDRD